MMTTETTWSDSLDKRLLVLVPQEQYDFSACATILSGEVEEQIHFTAKDCRLRFALISQPNENKSDEEEKLEEEVEEEPVRWTPEVDKLLIAVCNANYFDFELVSVELGKLLGRRCPVNARICRMRYAALDKHLHFSKQHQQPTPQEPPAPAATSPPSPTLPLPLPLPHNITNTTTATPDPTIMLELPSDALMSALASSFDSKDNSEDTEGREYATTASASGGDQELSELAQVLAFLDSEEANTDRQGKATFEELFGISEDLLDRAKVSEFMGTGNDDKEKEKDQTVVTELPDGKFDLTKFADTFDRVARAIGATE
jgi:hypothetical protein